MDSPGEPMGRTPMEMSPFRMEVEPLAQPGRSASPSSSPGGEPGQARGTLTLT